MAVSACCYPPDNYFVVIRGLIMAMFRYFDKWTYCINVLSIIQLCTLTICTRNGSYKSGCSTMLVLEFLTPFIMCHKTGIFYYINNVTL